jgi:hypothetical protein
MTPPREPLPYGCAFCPNLRLVTKRWRPIASTAFLIYGLEVQIHSAAYLEGTKFTSSGFVKLN